MFIVCVYISGILKIYVVFFSKILPKVLAYNMCSITKIQTMMDFDGKSQLITLMLSPQAATLDLLRLILATQ